MGRINAEWHKAHRMPRNPTLAQRLEWHRGHAENCACREMPESIRRLIEEADTSASTGQPGKDPGPASGKNA